MLQRFTLRLAAVLFIAGATSLAACQPAEEAADEGEESAEAAAESEAPAEESEAAAEADDAEEVTHTVTTEVTEQDGQRMLVATVTPAEGYKNNMEYPRWQVAIDEDAPAAAGAEVNRDAATTFEEEQVVFHIPIEDGEAAGDVAGRLRFSVCNDEACLTPTEDVEWTLASAE